MKKIVSRLKGWLIFLSGILLIFSLSSCSRLPLQGTEGRTNSVDEAPKETQAEPANDEADTTSLVPSPDLSPDQVVKIQLEALKNNNRTDDGIEIVFRFASPANKRNTGPLTRFTQMIKTPTYRPMLNHLRAELDPIEITGDVARQRVTLIDATGNEIVYVFFLSKQTEGPCVGCWMTDAVIVESVKPGRTA